MARLISFEQPEAFHFGILATSLLCFLVILVGRGMQSRLASREEPFILKWLADTSYSTYLFHWPLLVVFAAWGKTLSVALGTGAQPVITFIANIIALLLTFVCAGLSQTFIEKPFAHGGGGPAWILMLTRELPGKIVTLAGMVVVVFICVIALITAPNISSMDASLRQGAVALQAGRLEEAHLSLAKLDSLHADSGAVYIGPGLAHSIEAGKVTMIGDSVAVFPSAIIAEKSGAYIDAEVGRSMESGVPLILSMQANGQLGEIVVVALATNAHAVSYSAARELCEQLAPGHRLVLVTAHGVGHPEMADLSAELRKLAEEFPFITIADWDSAIAEHEDWLAADGYHCDNAQAIDLYAKVVLDAIEVSKTKPLSKGA
jgi:hypothetical protein